MDTWQIILASFAILAAVGWAAAWTALKNIVKNAKAVRGKYTAAMADGTMSDEELKEMLPELVACIEDAAKLWQTLTNLAVSLIGLFKKK